MPRFEPARAPSAAGARRAKQRRACRGTHGLRRMRGWLQRVRLDSRAGRGTRDAALELMTLARFKAQLVTVTPEDTVEKAACIMRDLHVGCLIVTRQGRPAGVITDRDLVVRAVAAGRNPSNSSVGEFVTYDPITVSESEGIETGGRAHASARRETPPRRR